MVTVQKQGPIVNSKKETTTRKNEDKKDQSMRSKKYRTNQSETCASPVTEFT
jgi:hypothetical protein